MAIDPLTYQGLEIDDWPDPYPQAPGREAQPEVQLAVARFKASCLGYQDNNVLLWWLLGSSTQILKMGQDTSDYTDRSEVRGEKCSNCVFAFKRVVDGRFICSQIRGFIKPRGWCRLWEGV